MQTRTKRLYVVGVLLLLMIVLFIGFSVDADATFYLINHNNKKLDTTFAVNQGRYVTWTSYNDNNVVRTWTSSDENIAKIISTSGRNGENAEIHFKKSGTVTITCTCTNEEKASVTVTVNKFFFFGGQTDNEDDSTQTNTIKDITLTVGETTNQIETWFHYDKERNWESDKPDIADISERISTTDDRYKYAKITAKKAGFATIHVYADSDTVRYHAYIYVTVRDKISSVSLNTTSKNIYVGEQFTLTPTKSPSNAYGNATWTSSNTGVATVASGVVTGVTQGSATITYKFTDTAGNYKTAACTVNVWNKLTSLSLSSTPDWVYVGKTLQLTKTTNSGVTLSSTKWESLDTAKATVSNSGLVTGVSAGSVKIKCTCTDKKGTSKSAEKTITVVSGINSVDIANTPNWCYVGKKATLSVTKNPTNASGSGTWSSSNPNIATVSNGVVTGVSAGTTNITYTWTDSKGATASDTLSFTVLVKPTSVSISGTRWCYTHDTRKLSAVPAPGNVSPDKGTTTWSSSNNNVAEITTDGDVKGKAVGETKITCKWTDEKGTEVSTEVTFNVYKQVKGVAIDGGNVVYENQSITLTGTRIPTDVAGEAVWSSSRPNFATVSNGVVTGVSVGTTDITYAFTDEGGTVKTATKLVTVKAKIQDLTIWHEGSGDAQCYLNKTRKLVAKYTSESIYDGTVKWTSGNRNIATVDSVNRNDTDGPSCVIKGVSVGSTTITCTFVEANISKTINFFVRQPMTTIQISGSLEAWLGQTVQLTATVGPDNAYNKVVTWSSSDTSIATVDSAGRVTAKAVGEVTIKAVDSHFQGASASVIFTSKARVSDIKVDGTAWCWNGKTRTLTAVITPSTAHNKGVTWTSSNPAIATINESGVVTGHSGGWTTIRATAQDGSGVYGELAFEVRQQITKIEFANVKDFIWVGQENGLNLSPNITPLNPWKSDLVWISSNTNVATVDTTGWIVGVSKGTATITCTAKYGPDGERATASHTIEVKQQVAEITLSGDTEAWVGEELKIVATRRPSNANNTAVNWSVSDNTIVSIMQQTTGSITLKAIAPGEVIVTATAADGFGTTKDINVTVYQQVEEIQITGATWCYVGDKTTLTATCLPTYSYDKTVSWISSDTSIATIDANTGVVTGKSFGEVTFTAIANDGQGATATYTMMIYKKISSVLVSEAGFNLFTNGTNYAQLFAYTTPTTGTRDDRVIWSVADTSLVTITNGQNYLVGSNTKITLKPNQNGKLGSTTIMATSSDDNSKTVTSTINLMGFKLSADNLLMYVGGQYTLSALKTTADNLYGELYDAVKWEIISGSECVSLNTTSGSEITITANKSGTVKLRATATANNKAFAECTIKVKDFVITCDKNSIFTGRLSVNNYETATFTLKYEQGSTVEVKWTIIEGADYATLDKTTGDAVVLTPKRIPGKTQIVTVRATSTNGDANSHREYSIPLRHPVDEITLNKSSLILFKNTSYSVLATINSTAYNPGLTWTAPSSVTLTTTPDMHGATIKAGSTPSTKQDIIITANDGRGTEAKLGVTVRELYLSHNNITMYPNGTFDLFAYYTESNKSNGVAQNVVWSVVDGKDIVSISTTSGSGTTLTANKSGTATIQATATADTSATVTCKITVKDILVSTGKNILYVEHADTNETHYTTNAYAKVDGKDVKVTWSSSNPSLATIDKDTGVITGISTNGKNSTTVTITATIAATANSAEGKQSKTIEIRQQVTDAVIQNSAGNEKTLVTVYEGKSFNLKAIAQPSYAYDKQLQWTVVGGNNIISLSKTMTDSGEINVVKGLNVGSATIQITSNDGYVTKVLAECKVQVFGFELKSSKDSIFASRFVVTNPETATIIGVGNGNPIPTTWKIVQGQEFATLEYVSESSVRLVPKTITNKTETVVIRGTSADADANTYKDITITLKNPIDKVTLSETSLVLFTGSVYNVSATTNTVNPYDKLLNWSTPVYSTIAITNDSYAIKITAGNTPTAKETITVTANDGRGATANIDVAVKQLYLNTDTLTMYPNSKFELSAWYTYSTKNNGVEQPVKWEIFGGADVISLSSTSGTKTTVKALKEGSASIKITATEDVSKSMLCHVTVKPMSISFDKDIIYVKEVNTASKHYTTNAYAKVDGKNVKVTWESSNPAIATINKDTGLITGISTNGKNSATVTITATIAATANSAEGKQSKTIEIRQQVTDAVIQNSAGKAVSSVVIYENETYQLKAIASPSYAYNTKLKWNIVGSGVVSLSKSTTNSEEFITVKGLDVGSATIQIKSYDGYSSKTLATCNIQVKGLVVSSASDVIFASRVVVSNPETTTLFAHINDVAASVNWTIIKGGEFATLSANSGKSVVLTPKTIVNPTETVVVRGTTVDADVNTYKDISITLKNPVNTIDLTDKSLILFTDTSYNAAASITNNSYNKLLDWSVPVHSSLLINENTYNVQITAGNAPTAKETITVTANDGRGATASIDVAIKQLYLNTDTLTMYPNSKFELSAWYTYSTKNNGVEQPVKWEIISGADIVAIAGTSGGKTTVTANKVGQATIKATATENTQKSVTCNITVKEIALSFGKDILYVKEANTASKHYQTNAYSKVDGKDVKATWNSSNPALATIDKNTGVITGISTNDKNSATVTITATIAATANSAEGKQSKTIEIRQQVTDAVIQNSTGKAVSSVVIYQDQIYQLTAISLPEYAYNRKLNLKVSGGSNIVTLSKTTINSGELVEITGVNAGTVTLQVTANDGITSHVLKECTVQVRGVTLKSSASEIFASRLSVSNPMSATLTAYVDGVEASMNWTIIKGGEFATLSANSGKSVVLTPKTIVNATETIIVRGTTVDADVNTYKDITITLKNPVDTITLSDYEVLMYTNTSYSIDAALSNNAFNKKLNWSKPSVSAITVANETHRITITAKEKTTIGETITVTANDGRGATNSLKVVIRKLLLSADSAYITPGSAFKLSAMYTYDTSNFKLSNCTALAVDWSIVSGADVVKLSKTNGADTVVTGLKAGTAVVKATTIDGDANTSITCKITVQDVAISFDQDVIYVKETSSTATKYQTVAHATIAGVEMPATWTSANSALATIDKNTGAIVGISTNNNSQIKVAMTGYVAPVINSSIEGYTQVTTTGQQTKAITIRQQVTDAVIQNTSGEEKNTLVMYENETYQLKAIALPSYAHNTKLRWNIVGNGVIELSKTLSNSGENITVKAIGIGNTTIQIYSNDGIVTKVLATCTVKVKGLVLQGSHYDIFASRLTISNPETTTLMSYVDGVEASVKWEVVKGGEFVTLSSNVGKSVILTPKTITNATEEIIVRSTTIDADANTQKDIIITLKNPVDTIILSDYEVLMYTNTSCDVDALITNNSYNKNLNWSKPSVSAITVANETHRITITAKEKTTIGETITVTANDGRGATNSLKVVIRKLLLSADSAYITPGSTFKLSAMYTYDTSNFKLSNCTALAVDWSIVSGADVVKLSKTNGADTVVTGLKAGTAVVKATTIDGDANTSITCKITVQDIAISFDQDVIYVKENSSTATKYQTVAHATIAGVEMPATWTSANSALATIDKNTGAIVGISTNNNSQIKVAMTGYVAPVINSSIEGYTQVTTTGQQTKAITIRQQVTDAVIQNTSGEEKNTLVMYENETYSLMAIVAPSYSHNKNVQWVVAGADVISVSKAISASGEAVTVNSLKAGTATIQVLSQDGVVTKVLAECDVRVKSLSLQADNNSIFASRVCVYNPQRTTLHAYVDGQPSENVNWSITSGSNYADLQNNTGSEVVLIPKTMTLAQFDLIIRATTTDADANTSKTIIVTLKNPVETISLSDNEILMYTDTSCDVSAKISNNSFNKLLDWSTPTLSTINVSNDTHKITITAGKKATTGETITVTANDGRGATNSMTVIIRTPILSADSAYITPGSTFKLSAMYTYNASNFNLGNCTELSVNWSVASGTDVVKLSKTNGTDTVVTGLKAGTAVVKATTIDGDANTSITCKVVVQDIAISFDQDVIYVKEKNSRVNKYQTVAHATIAGVEMSATWTSANSALATIDKNTGAIVGISTNNNSQIKVAMTGYVAPVINSSIEGYTQVTTTGQQTKAITIRQQVTDAVICDETDSIRTSITIYKGATYRLKAVVSPDYAYNKNVNWSVTGDNAKLSTKTSASGTYIGITGMKPGITTIKIVANDGVVTKVLAECEVVVKELTLNYNSVKIYHDGRITLRAYSTIYEKVNQSVTWSTDDETVIALDRAMGEFVNIAGRSSGYTTVTATTTDADANISVSCVIDTRELRLHVNGTVFYTSHIITPESMTLLEANAKNLDGEDVECKWFYEYIDCEASGFVSSVSHGNISTKMDMSAYDVQQPVRKVKITITSTDATEVDANMSDSKIIEFRQQVYTISPSKSHLVMYTGTQYKLDVAVAPGYAHSRETVWKSLSGEGVVDIIDGQFVGYGEPVTFDALKMGNTKLEVAAKDGAGAKTTIDIVVKELTLSDTNITIFKRSTYELFALVNGVVSESVEWSIGDESVVSIIEDKGTSLLMSAKEVGRTTITAKSKYGDTQAVITTPIEVLDIYVEAPIKEIYVGETLTMSAYIVSIDTKLPVLAEKIHWTSSDPSIATVPNIVSGTTTVTGVSGGYVIIGATTEGFTQEGYVETKIRIRQPVEEIQLTCKDDVLLYVGGSYPVTFATLPTNADTTDFDWEVLGGNYIAKFVPNGETNSMNLVGLHEGTATFKITAKDKLGASVTGTVTVKDFGLSTTHTLTQGEPYTISVNTFSDDATTVRWELESPYSYGIEFVSKNKDGVTIKYNYGGEATLTATTTDADGNVSVKCTLDMLDNSAQIVFDEKYVYIGHPIKAHVMSGGVELVTGDWKSLNPDIATIDQNGVITGVSVGTATIESRGVSAEIEVRQPVTEIKLSQSQIVIYGKNIYNGFFAIINPVDATDKGLNITHSNHGVVDVRTKYSGNKILFTLIGMRAGEDVITFSAADGQGATASCKVIVKELQFTIPNIEVYVGEVTNVSLLMLPDNRLTRANWSIEDETIATVSGSFSCSIVGKKVGVTKLTATTVDGDVNTSITSTVTVKQAITELSMVSTYGVRVNTSTTLSITINPANASNMDLEWIVEDNSILKVSPINSSNTNVKDIAITGLKVGSTTITAKAKDGHGATAKCVVTVYDDTTVGDTRIEHDLTLLVGEKHTLRFNGKEIDGWSETTTWSCNSSNVKILSTTNNSAEIEVVGGAYTNVTVTATTMQNGKILEHVYSIFINPQMNLPTSLTLYEGTTYTLSAGMLVEWNTTAALVVPISSKLGNSTILTARDPGKATIIAKPLASASNTVYTCDITVKRLVLDASAIELWVNDTVTLSASCDKIAQNVKWSASNNNVALNTTSGTQVVLTGKAAGSVVISATTTDGDANTTVTQTVTVKQQVAKLTMKNTLSVYVGKSAELSILTMPSNVTMADIEFEGYDQDLISIKTSRKGVNTIATITGRSAGTTTITAKAKDGQGATAKCVVTVLQGAEKIELPATHVIYVGNSTTLSYTVLPDNTHNKTVTWTSSNPAVATINQTTGLIKGLSAGKTTITVTATDGSQTRASCQLTVLQHIETIILENSTLNMYTNYGDTPYTAKIGVKEILPADASDFTLSWTSDKPEYITVDSNGLCTVQVNGLPNNKTYETVTITCSALDGSGAKAKCIITLRQHVSGVVIIDYEQFFNVSNGVITGLTEYALEKLANPNVVLDIPSKISNETIVEIADNVFANCDTITSITIPSTVTTIGQNTFIGCDNLKNIYINGSKNSIDGVPWGATEATIHWLDSTDDEANAVEITITADNRHLIGFTGSANEKLVIPRLFYDENGQYYKVVAIGDEAFKGCTNLISVTMPDSVVTIGVNAFQGCTNLKTVTLSNNLAVIGNYAFANTSLTSITIYDAITTIGANAFSGCNSLTTINVIKFYNEIPNGPWGATKATVNWQKHN